MNKFLFVLLALISFQAFAINPQDGGAGNVCMTALSRGYHVAVDTVYFPSKDKIYEDNNSTRYLSPLILDYTNSDSNLRSTNLTKTKAGRAVLGILGNIADKFDKDFGHELLNIFMTLSYVYMVDYEYKDVYGIKMDVDGFCNPGSMVSVIVTNWAGFSVISRKTWDKLNFQTQKILLLHEVIRIAQLSRSWFMNFNDIEIYRLTMAIYGEDFQDLRDDQGYVSFKDFTKKFRSAPSKGYIENLRMGIAKALKDRDSRLAYQLTLTLCLYLEKDDPYKYHLTREIIKLKKKKEYIEGLKDIETINNF